MSQLRQSGRLSECQVVGTVLRTVEIVETVEFCSVLATELVTSTCVKPSGHTVRPSDPTAIGMCYALAATLGRASRDVAALSTHTFRCCGNLFNHPCLPQAYVLLRAIVQLLSDLCSTVFFNRDLVQAYEFRGLRKKLKSLSFGSFRCGSEIYPVRVGTATCSSGGHQNRSCSRRPPRALRSFQSSFTQLLFHDHRTTIELERQN
jgi:hypothetical protein